MSRETVCFSMYSGHVEADHVLLVVEEVFGERAGEFSLADAGWAEECETADGTLGVLESGAGAAHGVRDGDNGLLLADNAVVEAFLHVEELFGLAFKQAINWYARPGGYEPADVLRRDDHLDFGGGGLRAQSLAFLLQAQPFGSELSGLFVFGALRGGKLLIFESLDACLGFNQVGGLGLGVNAEARGGLVNEVNRLVGQQPVGGCSAG